MEMVLTSDSVKTRIPLKDGIKVQLGVKGKVSLIQIVTHDATIDAQLYEVIVFDAKWMNKRSYTPVKVTKRTWESIKTQIDEDFVFESVELQFEDANSEYYQYEIFMNDIYIGSTSLKFFLVNEVPVPTSFKVYAVTHWGERILVH